jgi:hypothetical protein
MVGLTRYISKNMQIKNKSYWAPSIYDPYSNPNKIHDYSLLVLWSTIKMEYFPKGKWLMLTLILYLALFIFCIFRNHWQRIAQIGLLATLATLADMYVAIFGNGTADFVKHLFLANILFDVSTILFVSIALTSCVQIIQTKFQKARVAGKTPATLFNRFRR